jgi:CheY-like chemotaxis protein
MTWNDNDRPRVLLCDDSAVVRRLLRGVLEVAGCVVSEACDLVTAVAMLDTSRYDVVVTDLQEPRSDRHRLFSAAHEQRADLVVLTGADRPGRGVAPADSGWGRRITKEAAAAVAVVVAVKGSMARRRSVGAVRFVARRPLRGRLVA